MALSEEQATASVQGRLGGGRANLRGRTARGTIVNGAFSVGTSGLQLVKGVAVASFLAPSVYGLWGLLLAAFFTILTLGGVGIDDKYVQQDDADQKRAFQLAFTFQCIIGAILVVFLLVGMPLFGRLYGHTEIVVPGMVLALTVPALVLETPIWVHYRRLDFVRQRSLAAIDPVVSLVFVVGLTAAGMGLWGLVVGELIGTWAAAAVIVRASPYPLGLRWDRGAAREYMRFSWPLFMSAIAGILMTQGPVIVGSRLVGISAIAGLVFATNIGSFTMRVDQIVTNTLYPAVCAVKSRTDLLFESFWKSNRLALLWAAPVGVAAALFVGDFVHYVIGDKWAFAVPVIALFAVNAVINQVAFNWSAFLRARGDTRPIGIADALTLAMVIAIGVPLLATHGLTGFGYGLLGVAVITVCIRLWFLRRLFPARSLLRHIAPGLAPTVPALAAVLLLRALASGARTPGRVLAEMALFAAIAVGATYLSERPLLSESVGYLRGRRPPADVTT